MFAPILFNTAVYGKVRAVCRAGHALHFGGNVSSLSKKMFASYVPADLAFRYSIPFSLQYVVAGKARENRFLPMDTLGWFVR